jgi:membrane protein
MVFGMAFLVIVSLLFSTAISALGKWWGPFFSEGLAHALDLAISFVLLIAGFALIYRYVPRATIKWRDVWVGATVTAALFTIGKWAIGLYLGKSAVASSFGAFASLVIVMVWVYYSAQIFLLGAEFTRVYARTFGSLRDSPQGLVAARDADAPTATDAVERSRHVLAEALRRRPGDGRK